MSINPSDIDPSDRDAFEESRTDYEEGRADIRREERPEDQVMMQGGVLRAVGDGFSPDGPTKLLRVK